MSPCASAHCPAGHACMPTASPAAQHAVTFAAGLACEGMIPFAAIYSSFLQRGYDQIVHDVCLQSLPGGPLPDRARRVLGAPRPCTTPACTPCQAGCAQGCGMQCWRSSHTRPDGLPAGTAYGAGLELAGQPACGMGAARACSTTEECLTAACAPAVRFAMDRAGLVGADGATHCGFADIAYMGCLPNMVVMAVRHPLPACAWQAADPGRSAQPLMHGLAAYPQAVCWLKRSRAPVLRSPATRPSCATQSPPRWPSTIGPAASASHAATAWAWT